MRIQVKVKPNSRESSLEEVSLGAWSAQLKSPPVDGKANVELVSLLARRWGVPKSAVVIKGGASSRVKWVEIRIDEPSLPRPAKPA